MYHIIINPASRSGKGLAIWKEQVEPILLQEQVSYRSYFSKEAGDVAKITGEIIASATTFPVNIIILGGDGTVNEALQGISEPAKVVIGYIPTGSSNDFARDLKLPKDPAVALDMILHSGKVVNMDLGTVTYDNGEKRRFAVSCGIGFDAAICEEAMHSKMKVVLNKLGLGKLTYVCIALKQLISAKKVSCVLTPDDDQPIKIDKLFFVASMLHRYEGGGFMFCPEADYADGIIDLCVAGDLPKPLVLLAIPTALKGKHYRFKGITPYKAKTVKIETNTPLWVHTDGEVTRRATSLTVTCDKQALQIICP
ncbi:MAG: diacylglycerol kinase family lipid kinase [Lachnospiraceae bacterium]|nr:diacylglycerol kinase family lipid kinase [Lachnospiraceae bacterium]